MSRKRVFLYVQHLLGIGHLKRAATLAAALRDSAFEVTVATGGSAVPGALPQGVHIVQLPPATAADVTFKTLLDAQGAPIDEAWRSSRRDALLAAWRGARAHALVVEQFPFGRRQMRFELLPLLELASHAVPRPVIVSSVRDVLGQSDPVKQDETLALFERHFDHVLVHGDPGFVRFDRTFRHASRISGHIHYTGFIVDRAKPARAAGSAGAGEVIVSAGGGAVGATLLEAAIHAAPLSVLGDRVWRLLAGVNMPAPQFEQLCRLAARGAGRIIVERSRPDFRALLQNCALSVSQAGYNTLMEIIDSGARAVVVPFAAGNETEQSLRARLLAERGRIEVVEEDTLTPARLAAAIGRAMQAPQPARGGLDLDGARRSAELLASWTGGLAW